MAIEYRTEPDYIEYLDGEAHPKVNARRAHAILEAQLSYTLIRLGARRFGTVGSEQDAAIGKRDGTRRTYRRLPDRHCS